MNGHFSEEALQQFAELAAESQYVSFAEVETYDFTRCVRPNGTAYGTGGKCRKGTEKEKQLEAKTPKKKKSAALTASIPEPTRQSVARTKELAKIISESLKASKKQVNDDIKPAVQDKGQKVTDQKLKEAFTKALASLERAEKKGNYDAEYKARESVNLLRGAYHAENREEFIKISAEISRNSRQAEKLRSQASREARLEGKTIPQLASSHPAKKKWQESLDLDSKYTALKEKRDAAYYGEPSKTSSLKSSGGGKVDPAVPSSLPRGGGDAKLKQFLDGSEVVMAFPSKGFQKFVEDGVAKNGFEAGTEGIKKGNSYYLDLRRRGEEEVLNIPSEAGSSKRPVYAAMEHPDRSRSLQGGQGNLMAQYGGIQVVLNDSVKDRSTFTYGDSIDFNEPQGIKASPVRDPANPKSYQGKIKVSYSDDNPHSKGMRIETSKDDPGITPPYVETQIHGGLKLSDVKEVRYYRGNEIDQKVRSLLEQNNIKIVELPPQMKDLDVNSDHPNFSNIETIASSK
jgi:hypothetical protein